MAPFLHILYTLQPTSGVMCNHSFWSNHTVVWPSHQRGRFPFQMGSKWIVIPTIHRLSGEESGMTSHWFFRSELQDAGCMTSLSEVIMTNVKLWPADFSSQPFPDNCHHTIPEFETSGVVLVEAKGQLSCWFFKMLEKCQSLIGHLQCVLVHTIN